MLDKLPPRERQIVDLLYACGDATVAELCDALPDGLTASAVRTMLTRLEAKQVVERVASGRGILFKPKVVEAQAKQSALRQVVRTFFGGSPVGAVSALIGMSDPLTEHDLDELERLVANARQETKR
jgi:predicted transcriptional regulator